MVKADQNTSAKVTPKIVLIGGPSGGGKTTFAKKLLAACGDRSVLISTDNYYIPLHHLTLEERTVYNFDHPDSLDFKLLVRDLELLRAGQVVSIPTYDFAMHARTETTIRIEPRPVVIVEGILALVPERLRSLGTLRIFVKSPIETCLARRTERDIRERGRSPESITAQWNATVLPMYLKFCAPSEAFADLIVAGDSEPDKSAGDLNSVVKRLFPYSDP